MTEDEIRNIIIGGGLGTGKFSETQMASAYDKIILELANDLIDSFTAQIEKDTGSSSGELKQSIVPKIKKGGFDIEAEYYYKFIDDGVKGVGKFSDGKSPIRSVVTNGLYQFKNLGVPSAMANSIREWSGASIEQSYAIAVNIKNYGIKPKNITDKVITEEVLERISQDLLTATGLIVSVSFNKTFE
tara:strand:+ start:801 stop:1361 length:561 start_codon:yes stop_codon:yes gene_type:complete